ncbi:MAG: DnaT-like ssDNA-binding domain-containing protein, partial [Gimesia chilikensis]
GIINSTWNTKFIEHIRKQWAKYSASFGIDDTPRPISPDWSPSADCYEILQLAEIDEEYARSRVPEFVMYWKDSKQAKSSWNTVFLQYIKQDWAKRLKQQAGNDISHAENQTLIGSSQQRIEERFQRIADRSWAD